MKTGMNNLKIALKQKMSRFLFADKREKSAKLMVFRSLHLFFRVASIPDEFRDMYHAKYNWGGEGMANRENKWV